MLLPALVAMESLKSPKDRMKEAVSDILPARVVNETSCSKFRV